MFILSAQRGDDIADEFARYRAYLAASKASFPPSAFALATSDWWFDFRDHRCPHDAWLETAEFRELPAGKRNETRSLALNLRLLGAYRDGYIDLRYSRVAAYSMRSTDCGRGHRDWRYDEFRLSERGRLLHEIEFWGRGETAVWTIECADVELAWTPNPSTE